MSEKIELPKDPKRAMHEASSYINCISTNGDRAVKDCDGEIIGYYQLTEYLDGLKDIAFDLGLISANTQTDEQIKADAINEFVCSMIGALDSGFIEENTANLAQIHRVMQNYCKDKYAIDIPHIAEQWGEDIAKLCGLSHPTLQELKDVPQEFTGDSIMELEDLVGKHMLDGVDFCEDSISTHGDVFEDCSVCRFRIDSVAYLAVEDPEDGYRSVMSDLATDPEAKMKNVFPPVEVIGRLRTKGEYGGEDQVIEFIDSITGKLVLEIGTENIDDYYPGYVASFHPEAMAVNA